MQNFAPWPSPGGVLWGDFMAHVRFFAALCFRARHSDLGQWNADTLAQVRVLGVCGLDVVCVVQRGITGIALG